MGLWVPSNPEKVKVKVNMSKLSNGLAVMMNAGLSKITIFGVIQQKKSLL